MADHISLTKNLIANLNPHQENTLSMLTRTVTTTLSMINGDVFFSNRQTLTIPVNTVGAMGKGLALLTKNQFPDVYLCYLDVCRQKLITMGQPYLYKREASLGEELSESSVPPETPNATKWFLLFPTKGHWKENSTLEGIEQGLYWLRENYMTLKIQSLAVPALGCGLGKLSCGPLMCKYLARLDIHVAIYLPREETIAEEYLTKAYLLKDVV